MSRNAYYVGLAFFAMVNGLPFFSPIYPLAFGYSLQVVAEPLFRSVPLVALFASLMVSTGTLILAGLPAAAYERYIGAKDDSTDASLWIWLAGTAFLSIPAVGNLLVYGL
jgi:hypothetical protein